MLLEGPVQNPGTVGMGYNAAPGARALLPPWWSLGRGID